MDTDYLMKIWDEFDESFLIFLLEKTYRRLDYSVTNFHKNERIHEKGTDLLCEKDRERVAIQVKMRPRKGDIKQFKRFVKNARCKKLVYIYVKNPTKPFKDFLENHVDHVELWNSSRLHSFLLENECVEYVCLYFSMHPVIRSILNVHQFILQKRGAIYSKHAYTMDEISRLWAAKDNSVKVWVPLYFTYLRWNPVLMSKLEKEKQEFQSILDAVFRDLDLTYNLCGEKLVASFYDLSEKHPDIIGLFWKLISQRTNWEQYTAHVEGKTSSLAEALFFSLYYWICPVCNESKKTNMSGFYSAMNYLLENFHRVAKDVEYGIDWVFETLIKEE